MMGFGTEYRTYRETEPRWRRRQRCLLLAACSSAGDGQQAAVAGSRRSLDGPRRADARPCSGQCARRQRFRRRLRSHRGHLPRCDPARPVRRSPASTACQRSTPSSDARAEGGSVILGPRRRGRGAPAGAHWREDTHGWAALTVAAIGDARAHSPLLAEADREAIYEAFYDAALGDLDDYSRYVRSGACARGARPARRLWRRRLC